MSKDWIAGAVIVLTAIFTVVLPAKQFLLQSPSLYIGAMLFGVLAIGMLRVKIPETVESAMEDTHWILGKSFGQPLIGLLKPLKQSVWFPI
jgi:hypothetical protein